MARQTDFSPLNTFAMRPVANSRPAKYHRGHLDTEWQADLIMGFQQPDEYVQPVERTDTFRFQHSSTDNSSITLKFIDCHGEDALSIALDASAEIPGNLSVSGDDMTTYLYKLSSYSGIATDGIYYLLLTVDYGSSNVEQFISHPIDLTTTHEDTVLIEYQHSTNTQGTYFEQLPTRYGLRVEGYINDMEPASSDTVYEDQSYNLDLLDSIPYRGWKLYIGHESQGIPDWVLDKLNRIFACDNVKLDGKRYVKGNGAKWTRQSNSGNPLFAASIDIREANNTEGFTFATANLALFTIPSFPYAVSLIQIGETFAHLTVATATVINDGTEETAWIAALNAAASDYELSGTFVKSSGVLYYQNAADEAYRFASSSVFTTKLSIELDAPPLYLGFSFQSYRSSLVVDWGDGDVTNESSFLTTETHTHAYVTVPATYTIDIWGTAERLTIEDVNIVDVTGVAPATLKVLNLEVGEFDSDEWDWDIVAPAATKLESISVINSGLTTSVGMGNQDFTKLLNINFSGNAFSDAVASAWMYDVFTNVYNVNLASPLTYGTFSLVQSPTVVLTAGGNTNKADLENNFFWTVNI